MGLEKEVQNAFSKVLSTFEKLEDVLLSLKDNTVYTSSNLDFRRGFIDEHIDSTGMHIDTLNSILRKKNSSKRAVEGITQMIGSFVRHFGDSMFATDKSELIKSLIGDLMDSSRSLDKLLQEYENQS